MDRRNFTREFKLEAVKLIKERGVSYVQASRDLDVQQSVLRNWVKAFAVDPLCEPYGVREAGWISLSGCQPNRQQARYAGEKVYARPTERASVASSPKTVVEGL